MALPFNQLAGKMSAAQLAHAYLKIAVCLSNSACSVTHDSVGLILEEQGTSYTLRALTELARRGFNNDPGAILSDKSIKNLEQILDLSIEAVCRENNISTENFSLEDIDQLLELTGILLQDPVIYYALDELETHETDPRNRANELLAAIKRVTARIGGPAAGQNPPVPPDPEGPS